MAKSPAWQRKEGQNPEGGLNAKGRASLRAQGHDIKPPVSAKQAAKSDKAAARRKSFCACRIFNAAWPIRAASLTIELNRSAARPLAASPSTPTRRPARR